MTDQETPTFSWDRDTPIGKAVGEAMGYASMCWSETPTGVFDSEKASKLVDELTAFLNSRIPTTDDYVEILRATNGEYHWRRRDGGNHRVIAIGGETFVDRDYAFESAQTRNRDIADSKINYLPPDRGTE